MHSSIDQDRERSKALAQASEKELKKGDRVEWNTAQGKTEGIVKKKLTEPTEIKEHHVAASQDNPEYLVESSKTGKEAAHKPEALDLQE